MFAGINMFWARLRLILARAVRLFLLSKRQQTLKWLLEFEWLLRSYDYFILTFNWFISAGSNTFQPAKFFILARKMRHNARQSDNNKGYTICFIYFISQRIAYQPKVGCSYQYCFLLQVQELHVRTYQ